MLFGLGKKRSEFGKFLDQNRILQEEIAKESGVNRNTISRLTKSSDHKPNMSNANKIIKTLRKNGYEVNYDDFWE